MNNIASLIPVTSSGENPLGAFEQVPARKAFNPNGKEHSNCFAAGIDSVGHKITWICSFFLTGVVRTFVLDFKPGFWGQSSSAAREVSLRAIYTLGLIALSPIALLGAIVGGALRSCASLAKRDFVLHQQTDKKVPAAASRSAAMRNKISIFSYNVLLMPEFITRRNKQRPSEERTGEIADAIIAQDADFVCLQEAFNTESTEILDKRLFAAGYNVVRNIGHSVTGLNSGLFLASKHRLEDVQFFEHPGLKAGVDSHANKGVVLSTSVVNGKRVVIANTHLNGGGSSPAGSATARGYSSRAAQVLAVTSHIQKYIKDQGRNIDGIVLSGDTNISPTYYGGRDKDGRLIPKIEPEWFLAGRLQQRLQELTIPKVESMDDPKAWEIFVRQVDKIKDDLNKECEIYNLNKIIELSNELAALPCKTMADFQRFKEMCTQLKNELVDLSNSEYVRLLQNTIVRLQTLIDQAGLDKMETAQTFQKRLRGVIKDLSTDYEKNKKDVDDGENNYTKAKIRALIEKHRDGGGAFPCQLFQHDLQTAPTEAAFLGSTIDMDANPEVGWGNSVVAQPERVDFVMPLRGRLRGATLELKKVDIVKVCNAAGKLCSDHLGIMAILQFNAPIDRPELNLLRG